MRTRRRRLAALVMSGALATTTLCAGPLVLGPAASAARRPAGTAPSSGPPDVVDAPVQVVATAKGTVSYREVGSGPPLLLVMGYGGGMDAWQPSFVDALAARHRVVIFDNAGIGDTSPLGPAPTIAAMAEQTSALIAALELGRPDVLGWSMGGMIAQALAVTHPDQVGKLVLAATQPGTGTATPPSLQAQLALESGDPAAVLALLFPPDQAAAALAYEDGILEYPGFYQASPAVETEQAAAADGWFLGADAAGRLVGEISAPTLIADGSDDLLDPATNDAQLAAAIAGSELVLYPDAGHAFLFQDAASFVARLSSFLS
jgi:pimeloyl-ACP methyl ester carboxylesterase